MTLNKQASRFMNRKIVKNILLDKKLSTIHISRLNKLFTKFRCKEIEDMHRTLALFVLYDLNNYEGRLRRLKGIPGTTRYTQLLRYGKQQYKRIYDIQTERKTRLFKNKISYWVDQGLSLEHAQNKVSEVQTLRSSLSPSTQKGASEYSIRCVPYWIKRGFSEEEAKIKVANAQRRSHSFERNQRWLKTLSLKSDEEKKLINAKKSNSITGYLARGFDEKTAEKLSNEYYKKRNNYSKTSQAFFSILDNLLGSSNVYYKSKNYEKQFCGKCVDFYDSGSGVVVEYYGDFWHRNPLKYNSEFVSYGLSSKEIWELDSKRIETIKEDNAIKNVIIVWESQVIKNPHEAALKIIKEIENARI